LSKIVVIHQPDFLPYLGFFHRLLRADQFVVLDNVQFVSGTSRSWTNRDKIKTTQGERWLTLSIEKHPRGTPIHDIKLSQSVNWRRNNLDLLEQNYKRARFYNEMHSNLENLYGYEYSLMIEINMKSIYMLCELLDIQIEMVYASTLGCDGRKNELLVNILNKVNATHYLSGIGAKDYFQPKPFDQAGIQVCWQEFEHPIYPQLHGNFIPFLSSIDLLYNCGIKESRRYIRRKT